MKSYIAVLSVYFLFFMVFCTEEDKIRNEIFSNCLNSTGYTGALEFDLDKNVSSEAKCFFACVAAKQGLQVKDGQVNYDLLNQAIDEMEDQDMVTKYKAALQECSQEGKSEEGECEMIFEHIRCWEKKLTAMNKTSSPEEKTI